MPPAGFTKEAVRTSSPPASVYTPYVFHARAVFHSSLRSTLRGAQRFGCPQALFPHPHMRPEWRIASYAIVKFAYVLYKIKCLSIRFSRNMVFAGVTMRLAVT